VKLLLFLQLLHCRLLLNYATGVTRMAHKKGEFHIM
jgi:hypothetical protein